MGVARPALDAAGAIGEPYELEERCTIGLLEAGSRSTVLVLYCTLKVPTTAYCMVLVLMYGTQVQTIVS